MAAPAKLVSTSQGFQDAKGTVIASGTLWLQLSQNCEITASGGQVTSQPILLPLDSNGKITSTAIWFNDELTPAGTVYYAKLYASNGSTLIQDFGGWSIAGASADLSTVIPTSPSVGAAGAVVLNPSAQQNINGQTLNMEGASLSFSASASTTADSFFSRLAAGIIGVGTAIGNALGTLRAAIIQIGGSDTGFSRDAAGVIDAGNGTQGDKSATVFANKFSTSGTALGSNGDIVAARSSNAGYVWYGSDGANAMGRNGTTIDAVGFQSITLNGSSSGTTILRTSAAASGTLTMPAATDTLVGKATTDNLTNKNFLAAGSGNSVNLPNQQGPAAAIVGTGSDVTLFTYTIPANTIQAGKGFRVDVSTVHSTGSASVTYKVILGTTTLGSWSDTGAAASTGYVHVFNAAGVQNSQYGNILIADGPTITMNNVLTASENLANALAIKITFSVANTDQVTPKFWKVTIEQ